ncbi:uracil-DNA glycosylase family protein [Cryptosporidium serpentis]
MITDYFIRKTNNKRSVKDVLNTEGSVESLEKKTRKISGNCSGSDSAIGLVAFPGCSDNFPYESLLRSYIGDEWFGYLKGELAQPYFTRCFETVRKKRQTSKVYPSEQMMFSAFKLTPISKVSAVIIGQDPYHQPGQAMGLCFSVPKGVIVPPSLRNIYKEIGCTDVPHGDLTSWANQGVFMLNSLLSVEEGKPMSHKSLGWERFTSAVISTLNSIDRKIVFLLWGKSAQTKAENVCKNKHKVLKSAHPSPLSQKNFIGCGHFQKCNDFLRELNRPEIDWVPTK